jgi:cytochrome c biogenesis protein CcmG/thiol:disulfide interchange protein DsbE
MVEQSQALSDVSVEYPPLDEVDAAVKPANRRTMLWRVLIVGVLLVFVWFLAVGLQHQNVSERRANGVAPGFEFTTFEGETINLNDLRGKGVVVNFWASWCDPCRAEAALLEESWRRERDQGIVFIGLDYLDQEHSARAYIDEFQITYPNGQDVQSAAARRYGIQGVPETFFIDAQGKITSMIIGPRANEADLNERLATIRPKE